MQSRKFEIENTSKVGTPFYLAPEIIAQASDSLGENERRNPYTPKSDMWALGIILYEMCALRKPFLGSTEDDLYKKIKESKPSTIPSISR